MTVTGSRRGVPRVVHHGMARLGPSWHTGHDRLGLTGHDRLGLTGHDRLGLGSRAQESQVQGPGVSGPGVSDPGVSDPGFRGHHGQIQDLEVTTVRSRI